MAAEPSVAVFGPNPMLSITVESLGHEGGGDIHLHAAGQGVWVARMAAELGARPVLYGFLGGETGRVLQPLLDEMAVDLRLVETTAPSGSYLHDRRSGAREGCGDSMMGGLAYPVARHLPGHAEAVA